jgi:dynactin-4
MSYACLSVAAQCLGVEGHPYQYALAQPRGNLVTQVVDTPAEFCVGGCSLLLLPFVLVAEYLESRSSGSLYCIATRSLEGHASPRQWRDECADGERVHVKIVVAVGHRDIGEDMRRASKKGSADGIGDVRTCINSDPGFTTRWTELGEVDHLRPSDQSAHGERRRKARPTIIPPTTNMAQPFPYTYYACDCFDSNTTTGKRASQMVADADEDEEGSTFDPRNARSNYALYPLEHLLYCEDCQQIRCPRCVIEETLNWYCPSCLFEVPSSVVKSDGNRCTRNCFNCPVCVSPLTVNSLENPDAPSATGGPYIMACPYCHWSTIETGIEFEKHTGVYGQLARIANGGKPLPTPKERDKDRERRKEFQARQHDARNPLSPSQDSPTSDIDRSNSSTSRDDLFSNLSAFYKSQMDAQTPTNPFSTQDLNFSSPSAYSRIMNMYSSTSAKKQKRAKPTPMREAASELEGLAIYDAGSDAAAIERIKRDGWAITLSETQKLAQADPHVQFDDELRPVPTLLCTKRSKRCRSCRHILSKPESKITSTRYKIKILALSHIPRLTIRALPSSVPPTPTSPSSAQTAFNYSTIRSGMATHFLLQLSNPLFDNIRVTLATPSTTPGKVQSRVTILCPQFEVGANTDVWDDALSTSVPSASRGSAADGQVEAGKIWDRGRNWTSVVIEVIPGFLRPVGQAQSEPDDLDEDEDLLEIPIFVRLEFETEANAEERGLGDSRGAKGEKERREEAFWTVVCAGRIA